MILLEDTPEILLDKMAAYCPPTIDKAAWILKISQGYKNKHQT
jgi:hypothetical protein